MPIVLYFVLQKVLTHVKQVVQSGPAYCSCSLFSSPRAPLPSLFLLKCSSFSISKTIVRGSITNSSVRIVMFKTHFDYLNRAQQTIVLVTSVAIPCFELSLFLCKANMDSAMHMTIWFHGIRWSTFRHILSWAERPRSQSLQGTRTKRRLWERDKKWRVKATRSLACAVLLFSDQSKHFLLHGHALRLYMFLRMF